MIPIPPIALSVRQPWAWAIIHAGKDIENRSAKAVQYFSVSTGRVAIHASKGMTRDEYEAAADYMARIGVECPAPADLVRGAIIGSVEITEIVKDSESPWFMGPRGLVLRAPEACEPVYANGQLGFFKWHETRVSVHTPVWMTRYAEKAARVPDLLEGFE